ncbi:hypothetical protein [Methylovorus sp. MM2]|nr:hypothetical protein [Methylovorus sp. MM2]
MAKAQTAQKDETQEVTTTDTSSGVYEPKVVELPDGTVREDF